MKLKAGNLSYYVQTKHANKYLPSIYLLDSSNLVCNQNTELLQYADDSIGAPPDSLNSWYLQFLLFYFTGRNI